LSLVKNQGTGANSQEQTDLEYEVDEEEL